MTELWGNGGKLNSRRPSFYDPGEPIAANDKKAREALDLNNQAFIRSMWDSHPRIMRAHEAAGRQVVRL